jgi:hypothetical protein
MLQKISYLGNDLFQLDDSTIPLETEDIKRLAVDIGKMNECQAKSFLEKLESSGEADLETTAATGVVVNVYEVDYVPPKDPKLETQQLGATVREQRDFITQYLFPSTETEDVIVGLRKDLSEHSDGGGRMPRNKKTSRKDWRQVLSWRTDPVEEPTVEGPCSDWVGKKVRVVNRGKDYVGVVEHASQVKPPGMNKLMTAIHLDDGNVFTLGHPAVDVEVLD